MLTTKVNRLWHLIEESLISNALKPCISYRNVELSYGEIHSRVNLITSFLFEKQISAFCNNCSNPISFVILQLAGIQLGIPSYLFLPKDKSIKVFDEQIIDSIIENRQTITVDKYFSTKESYSILVGQQVSLMLWRIQVCHFFSSAKQLNGIRR